LQNCPIGSPGHNIWVQRPTSNQHLVGSSARKRVLQQALGRHRWDIDVALGRHRWDIDAVWEGSAGSPG
jgi:hypothetical protein